MESGLIFKLFSISRLLLDLFMNIRFALEELYSKFALFFLFHLTMPAKIVTTTKIRRHVPIAPPTVVTT